MKASVCMETSCQFYLIFSFPPSAQIQRHKAKRSKYICAGMRMRLMDMNWNKAREMRQEYTKLVEISG